MLRAVVFLLALGAATPQVHAKACESNESLTEAAIQIVAAGRRRSAQDALAIARQQGSGVTFLTTTYHAPDSLLGRAAIKKMSRRSSAPVICGHAASEELEVLLVAEQLATIRVQRDQVAVVPTTSYTLQHAVVEDAEGQAHYLRFDKDGVAKLPKRLPRPLHLQAIAKDTDGPRPILDYVIGVKRGTAPPRPTRVTGFRNITEFFHAIRNAKGSPSLKRNRLLDAIAKKQALHACRDSRLRHRRSNKNPVQRMRDAGVNARVVGEVAARADTTLGALNALSASPSHRATIEDKRFTDAGVAIAQRKDKSSKCVVMLFASWPRAVGTTQNQ